MSNLSPLAEDGRRAELESAQVKALKLFDAIERDGLVRPGVSERQIEDEIGALAAREFGVEKHWHRRLVRAGPNTLATASDNPPVRTVAEDDIVYVDLGPVFEAWEADIGKSYALGDGCRRKQQSGRRSAADLRTGAGAIITAIPA